MPDIHGKNGGLRWQSGMRLIPLGQLVDLAGPLTRALVARESWKKPCAFGRGLQSQGTAGRPRGPFGTGPSRPGEFVNPVGHQSPASFRTKARGARDSWSNKWALGSSARGRVDLVDPEGLRTRAPVTAVMLSTPRGLGHSPSSPGLPVDNAVHRTGARGVRDCWSTPNALGPVCE